MELSEKETEVDRHQLEMNKYLFIIKHRIRRILGLATLRVTVLPCIHLKALDELLTVNHRQKTPC